MVSQWTIVAPAVLLLALAVVIALHGGPLPGDAPLARALAPFDGRIAAILSRAVSLPVWSGGVVVGAVALWFAGRPRAALLLVGTDIAAELVAFALKEVVARPRPPAGGLTVTDSFPSSSVTRVAIALGLVGLVLAWPRPSWRLPVALAYALAVLAVGAARVAEGAHWPSDVLGALLLSAVGLLLVSCVALSERIPSQLAESPPR